MRANSKLKRCLAALLLAVVFAAALAPAAFADTIIDGNADFLTRHQADCAYLNRNFYVDSASGSVSFTSAPDSSELVAAIPNGEIVNIEFTYVYNGVLWGYKPLICQNIRTPLDEWPAGWAPMSELLVTYDYIYFAETHQNDFYAYTGSFDRLQDGRGVVTWTWPGSGIVYGYTDISPDDFHVAYAYKDALGREWGFLGNGNINSDAWLCISDPFDTNIAAFNPPPPKPQLFEPASAGNPQGNDYTPLIVTILVLVVVVGTAVLIRVFWKPDRDN